MRNDCWQDSHGFSPRPYLLLFYLQKKGSGRWRSTSTSPPPIIEAAVTHRVINFALSLRSLLPTVVGVVHSHVALKPLVKKQMSAWRPITARLTLLRQLVNEFGLESSSGLAADSIMSFVQVRGGNVLIDMWP